MPSSPGFEIERVALDPALDLTLWFVPELGNASYRLLHRESGATILVDPARDVTAYRTAGAPGSASPMLALDTHLHNDFVSGSRELSGLRSGVAAIHAAAEVAYPHRGLRDGESVELADWSLEVLATPGHTPEHLAYLLRDPRGRDRALFSGGALMVGGAARTDLLGVERSRAMAKDLYHTLHERVLRLAADVTVLPTHQGGSFCGATRGDRHTTTIREERSSNPLLRARSLEEFLPTILAQAPYPAYFRRMRAVNRSAPAGPTGASGEVRALALDRWDRSRAEGAVVVDARAPEEFDDGHIPGSLAVPLDGPFSSWVGWLLPPERPILLLAPGEEAARDATRQLFRIGYDQVLGHLAGGFRTWADDGRAIARQTSSQGRAWSRTLRSVAPGLILDVRESHEWAEGHLPGSLNVPVATLSARVSELPRDVPLWVHCARGYRSTIAVSLLEQAGFRNTVHILGDPFPNDVPTG